jgi:hypothetical protein
VFLLPALVPLRVGDGALRPAAADSIISPLCVGGCHVLFFLGGGGGGAVSE